jgi:hypothetical protein
MAGLLRKDQTPNAAGQNDFYKGVAGFERGNHDIAMDLLMQWCPLLPAFSDAPKCCAPSQIASTAKRRRGSVREDAGISAA